MDRWFAKLASNSKFENLTLFIIILNAAWIGIDTETNIAPDVSTGEVHIV